MNSEQNLQRRGGVNEKLKSGERFGYLLRDPELVVSQWKGLYDRMASRDQEGPSFEDLEAVCLVFGRELVELTQNHPRQAAELIAEILRREDENFSHFARTEDSILYLAGRDKELATQVWEIFLEFCPAEIDESAQHMCHELRAVAGEQDEYDRPSPAIEAPQADRIAMAMFYIDHVSRYNTL